MTGWLVNIANVLPLGLIFGWIFYRTKNLWPGTIFALRLGYWSDIVYLK